MDEGRYLHRLPSVNALVASPRQMEAAIEEHESMVHYYPWAVRWSEWVWTPDGPEVDFGYVLFRSRDDAKKSLTTEFAETHEAVVMKLSHDVVDLDGFWESRVCAVDDWDRQPIRGCDD